jgi:hypothetical protein
VEAHAKQLSPERLLIEFEAVRKGLPEVRRLRSDRRDQWADELAKVVALCIEAYYTEE